jgi:hypothetical protein
MNTRAKFHCYSMKKYHTTTWVDGKPVLGFLYDYQFNVVSGNSSNKDDENNLFFASTPSGQVNLSSVRDDLFEPGKDYYLDFSATEKVNEQAG